MIGIVDWGIGGCWALARVLARCPEADVVYVSDAGNTPYGLQDRARLGWSLRRSIERARALGADDVLVACHSASTVLPDLDLPGVHGVISPEAVPRGGRILVLGGVRTIRSQAWRQPLEACGELVIQRIAQPLSAAVEAGEAEAPETREAVRAIVRGVGPVDTIVLACTHYAALAHVLEAALPGARAVDPALVVADRVAPTSGSGSVIAVTTGDVAAVNAAVQRALPALAGRVVFRAAR